MDQTVEAVPAGGEVGEEFVDLFIARHVAGEDQVAAAFVGEFAYPLLETFVLEGEGELGTFPVAGLGDAIGDGMLGDEAGDENLFVGEKGHVMFSLGG